MIKMNKSADSMKVIFIICLAFATALLSHDDPMNNKDDPTVHRLEKIVFHGNNVQGAETTTKKSERDFDNAPPYVWEWEKNSVIIAQPTASVPLSAVITPPLANGDQLTTPIQWSASGGTVLIPNADNPNHVNAVFDCPASVGLYKVTARLGNGNGTTAKTIAVYVAAPKIKEVTFLNSIPIRRDREATTSFGKEYAGISWRDDDLDGESDMGKPGAVDANEIVNGNGNIHSHPVAYPSKGVFSALIKLCPYVQGQNDCEFIVNNKLVFDKYDVKAEQCKPVVSWMDSNNHNSWHSCSITGLSASQNYEFIDALTATSLDDFRSNEMTGYEPQFQLKCEIGFGKTGVSQSQLSKFQTLSEHELYLLFRGNEATLNNSFSRYNYETIFHMGCTRAKGKSTVSQIIDSIWIEFTNLDVRKKGCTTPMEYCTGD